MTTREPLVQFVLDDSYSNRQGTARAAVQAFGISCGQAYEALRCNQTIICRPSQFALFLIYRSKEVTCNSFKQFKAELIHPSSHNTILNVSKS